MKDFEEDDRFRSVIEHPVEVADLSAPIRTLTGKATACYPPA